MVSGIMTAVSDVIAQNKKVAIGTAITLTGVSVGYAARRPIKRAFKRAKKAMSGWFEESEKPKRRKRRTKAQMEKSIAKRKKAA